MRKEHFVYKYQCGDEVIYIGMTDKNLMARICAHAQEEKFQPYLLNCDIFCARLANSVETGIMEKLLINKYKPVLNARDNLPGITGFGFDEPEWYPYSEYVTDSPQRVELDAEKRRLKGSIFRNNRVLADLMSKLNRQRKDIEVCYEVYDYLISEASLPKVYIGKEMYGDKKTAIEANQEVPCVISISTHRGSWYYALFDHLSFEEQDSGIAVVFHFSKQKIEGMEVQRFFVERFADIIAVKQSAAQDTANKIEQKRKDILQSTKTLELCK